MVLYYVYNTLNFLTTLKLLISFNSFFYSQFNIFLNFNLILTDIVVSLKMNNIIVNIVF